MVVAAWLILAGVRDFNSSFEGPIGELHFSNGALKVGLGLSAFAVAVAGVGAKRSSYQSVAVVDGDAQASVYQSAAESSEVAVFSKDSQKNDAYKREEFNACCQIFVQRGGWRKPAFRNSLIGEKNLILCDLYGKRLATFDKDDSGDWYCKSFYG